MQEAVFSQLFKRSLHMQSACRLFGNLKEHHGDLGYLFLWLGRKYDFFSQLIFIEIIYQVLEGVFAYIYGQ